MFKRLMAFLLTFVMVVGIFPIGVMAEELAATVKADQLEGAYICEEKIDSESTDGKVEITMPYYSDDEIIEMPGDKKERKSLFVNFGLLDVENLPDNISVPDGFNIDGFSWEYAETLSFYTDMIEDAKDGDDQEYEDEGILTDDEVNAMILDNLYGYEEVAEGKAEDPTLGAVKINFAKVTDGEVIRYYHPGETYEDEIYLIWYDATLREAVYQKFDIVITVEEPSTEEPSVLGDWENQDVIAAEGIVLDIRGLNNDDGAITGGYDSNGVYVVTVDVDKISLDEWKNIYNNRFDNATQIYVSIIVPDKEAGTVEEIYEVMGGFISKENFVANSNMPNAFNEYGEGYGGLDLVAQIAENGENVKIIPSGSGLGYWFVAYKYANGEIEYKILPFRTEIVGNNKNIEFADEKNYVDAERIVPETIGDPQNSIDWNNQNVVSVKKENGNVTYNYIGATNDVNNPEKKASEVIRDAVVMIRTKIKAPDGYEYITEDDEAIDFQNITMNVVGPENELNCPFFNITLVWTDKVTGEEYEEEITLSFNPGITYMDEYWEPVTKADRFIYFDNEGATNVEDLEKDGVAVSFNNKGFFEAEYSTENSTDNEINLSAAIYTEVAITVPDDGNEYVGFRMGESVSGQNVHPVYDKYLSDQKLVNMSTERYFSVDEMLPTMSLMAMDYIEVNGLTVWYTSYQGASRVLCIDWYTEDPTGKEGVEPAKREYIYVSSKNYYDEVTSQSTEEVTEEVTVPTAESEVDWELTITRFPQEKEDKEEMKYYFQLEGNCPGEGNVIYFPYSYLDPDLTFEEAEEKGYEPKLYHYYDDHSFKEEITGVCTRYGIKFVIDDFSPFVIFAEADEPEEEPEIPPTEDPEEPEVPPTDEPEAPSVTVEKETVIIGANAKPKEENEQNPNTGAPVCSALAGIVFVLAAALFGKK